MLSDKYMEFRSSLLPIKGRVTSCKRPSGRCAVAHPLQEPGGGHVLGWKESLLHVAPVLDADSLGIWAIPTLNPHPSSLSKSRK